MAKPSRDLDWLVHNRSAIQERNYQMMRLARSGHALFAGRDREAHVFMLLIGAGYSLWRAVFLVPGENPAVARMLETGKTFLEILTGDNAIGYYQELETSNWMVGYYINNTYYRMADATARMMELGGHEPQERLPEDRATWHNLGPQKTWERLFVVHTEIWTWLTRHMNWPNA